MNSGVIIYAGRNLKLAPIPTLPLSQYWSAWALIVEWTPDPESSLLQDVRVDLVRFDFRMP